MVDLRIENLQGAPIQNSGGVKQNGSAGFGELVKGAIDRVSKTENEADQSIMDLLQGKAEIHETMIALQKSDVSMRLFLSIRGKAMEAYQTIMRMQF